MQRLYVVGFQVSPAGAAASTPVFEQLTEHMALHLDTAVTGLDSTDLTAGRGTVVVPSRRPEWADTHLNWRPIAVDDRTRAIRLTIEHDLRTGGRFVCELTAAEHGGQTSFRVVLGRRSDGRLSPARVDDLKPPRALLAIMKDATLRCTEGPDTITSTVTNVLTAQVAGVRERLDDSQRRLPVLAVSAMRLNGASATFARKAAERLCGLSHVAVIANQLALDAFNDGRSDQHRLFRDSARLYWPDMDARSRWWDAAALHGNHDELLSRLMRTLTPLSVVARGRDRLWDAARVAGDDSALAAIAESEAARIALLERHLAEERAQTLELLEANEALEQQVRLLENEVENRDSWQAYAAPAPVEPATEDLTPTPDFTDQWDRWEARSEGALVFTDRAKASWADCGYADFEKMWEALDALADLAQAWRAAGGNVAKRLEDWIRERTTLKYAHSDEGLRRAGLDRFTFEGRTLNRTPHIKLGDHTKPNKVGRIYFAIDNDQQRWIVDHVGVKLHGL